MGPASVGKSNLWLDASGSHRRAVGWGAAERQESCFRREQGPPGAGASGSCHLEPRWIQQLQTYGFTLPAAFDRYVRPLRKTEWVVCATPPSTVPPASLSTLAVTPTAWRSPVTVSSTSRTTGSGSFATSPGIDDLLSWKEVAMPRNHISSMRWSPFSQHVPGSPVHARPARLGAKAPNYFGSVSSGSRTRNLRIGAREVATVSYRGRVRVFDGT